MCTARGGCSQSVAEDGPSLCDSCCWEQPTQGRSGCGSGGLMGVILQVALPSRVLAAARLQCGAAGAGASRGLGVCAEHARLAARGESARAMEIGDFLVGLGPGGNSQCVKKSSPLVIPRPNWGTAQSVRRAPATWQNLGKLESTTLIKLKMLLPIKCGA